jgi:hypothetical protein
VWIDGHHRQIQVLTGLNDGLNGFVARYLNQYAPLKYKQQIRVVGVRWRERYVNKVTHDDTPSKCL